MRLLAALFALYLPSLAGAAELAAPDTAILGGALSWSGTSISDGGASSSSFSLAARFATFPVRYLAIEFGPSFGLADSESATERVSTETWGARIGPRLYLPLATPVFFTASLAGGVSITSRTVLARAPLFPSQDILGLSLHADGGLAIAVGEAGLVELLATWEQVELEYGFKGLPAAEATAFNAGIGLGFAVIL